jgi:thioredoxin reductase/ferredoxin
MEYLVYAVLLALILTPYLWRRGRLARESRQTLEEATTAGLTEPASLHPIVDPLKCIGCGSCIKACPEQPEHRVLGLIHGKAELVGPTECIGHGACAAACPVGAISLVFGTATRGVDIPRVTPWFESNVPGIYIAGELGGMGLIRNAVTQGREAVAAVHERRQRGRHPLDLVIVGAGPAGFAASLAAQERGLRYMTLEQESLGGAVFQYPRGKIVMTQPVDLPIVGKVKIRTTSKEDLLELWREIESRVGLAIRYHERVGAVERTGDGFIVQTSKGVYETQSVLLAIGRRGTPRKLGVPGEELPKVVYRLIEPEQYAGKDVLVVGGGDSALEAAASIAELSEGQVSLSHRGEAFGRAKPRNRERVAQAERSGRLRVYLQSQVRNIDRECVALLHGGRTMELPNEAVIVNAGGVLPTDFLRGVGIEVETRWGTA